jgi:hypothetical protein
LPDATLVIVSHHRPHGLQNLRLLNLEANNASPAFAPAAPPVLA